MTSGLEPQLHLTIHSAAERGKTENLRVMLVRQIVDPAEDRQVRAMFWRRGKFDALREVPMLPSQTLLLEEFQ